MKKLLALLTLVIIVSFMIASLVLTNKKQEQPKKEQEVYVPTYEMDSAVCLNTMLASIELATERAKIEEEMQVKMSEIESIESKSEYFVAYKSTVEEYSEYFDAPETIYDYYTAQELDLLFRVVQAEIGNYSFEQKCNVVSVIFNRINSPKFPNTMSRILVGNQFSTISNGSIYKVAVDETTILACEYVFMFGDTTGGALFFDSNGALNYKFLFNDGAHNFYTTYN